MAPTLELATDADSRPTNAGHRQPVSIGIGVFWATLVAAVLLAASLISVGCGFGRAEQQASAAVDRFHQSYNANQYERIYDAADQTLKAGWAAPDFVALLSAVHRKLGQHLATHVQSTNLFVGIRIARVRLKCSSRFEDGAASEEFVWAIDAGGPRLLAYNINSPALILR